LAAAEAISDDYARARTLSELAKRLPEALMGQALAAAEAISDDFHRAWALSGLAEHLPKEVDNILWRSLCRALATTSRGNMLEAVGHLAVASASWDGSDDVLQATLQAIQDVVEWWP
jgi:hypothetical protein